jgi:hypothetical protein
MTNRIPLGRARRTIRACQSRVPVSLFDVVGAVLVVLGLFRGPLPLTPGWARGPTETAEDRAHGTKARRSSCSAVTGQLLGAAGSGTHGRTTVIASGCVALGVGVVVAFILYGVTYDVWFRQIMRFVHRKVTAGEFSESYGAPYRRVRRGPRFWNREP